MLPVAHAATEELSISLAPYVIGEFFGVPLTSTLIAAWVAMAVLLLFAVWAGRRLTLTPSGTQTGVELLIGGVYDYMADVLESRELARKVLPVILTLFLFILTINWIGLLPGVDSIGMYKTEGGETSFVPFLHPGNTDLNITIAFAIVAVLTVQVAGVALLGFFKYAGKFINFSSPIAFAIGIIELISEVARLVSFSFRLFGNIFAGKTLLVVVMFFVPFVAPVPLLAFEVFVGLIQAFVFAILTLFFVKVATTQPH